MTTHRLTDEEFALATRIKPKLSLAAPGHWRCAYALDEGRFVVDETEWPEGWLKLGDAYICPRRWVSEEVADEMGARAEAALRRYPATRGWRYARAEFFPGERP